MVTRSLRFVVAHISRRQIQLITPKAFQTIAQGKAGELRASYAATLGTKRKIHVRPAAYWRLRRQYAAGREFVGLDTWGDLHLADARIGYPRLWDVTASRYEKAQLQKALAINANLAHASGYQKRCKIRSRVTAH